LLPSYARLPLGISGQTTPALRHPAFRHISRRVKRGGKPFLGIRKLVGNIRPLKKKLTMLTTPLFKHGGLT
jgi:hypothetical protein